MRQTLIDAGHRLVWQQLPRDLRRSLLFSTSSLLAPSISRKAALAAPFIVVGALRSATGLGESARLCLEALKVLGMPVYGIDIGPALMQPEANVAVEFEDGRHLMGAGTFIVHVNAPLMSLGMLSLPRSIVRGKRVVGYWAWELPEVPRDWLPGLAYVLVSS